MRKFDFYGHFIRGNNPDNYRNLAIGNLFHGILNYDENTNLWSLEFTIEPHEKIVNNSISPQIKSDKFSTEFFGDHGDWEMDYTLGFNIVPSQYHGMFKINVYDPDIAANTYFEGPLTIVYEQ